ncbi:MAG: RIP metalloprotease RseP [Phycisphaerae bacterium]|nr:RIP metalloprotease RseP [Phycisphaerae bacterium]
MLDLLMSLSPALAFINPLEWLAALVPYLLIFFGFSMVIFVHELGHFVVAKLCDIRVERFAVGFFREIWGFTRGETRYSFNILPLGGYVKMLGQEDFEIDKSGEIAVKADPRSFSSKSVGKRMAVISAGVLMNVLFAGVIFAVVFMIGMPAIVPKIGMVVPNLPADAAGLLPGDEIEAINGRRIRDFKEVQMAIVLAAPLDEIEFTVNRHGERKTIGVVPINTEDKSVQQIGIANSRTSEIAVLGLEADPRRPDSPHIGDRIVSVDGMAVTDENANEVLGALVNPAAQAHVVVERPEDPDNPNSPRKRVELVIPSRIAIRPHGSSPGGSVDVLGLTPLARVSHVEAEGRAYLAGLKAGDVIVKWGEVSYPTREDIRAETRRACTRELNRDRDRVDVVERDIPVRIWRPDAKKEIDLVIRPLVKRTVAQRIDRLVTGAARGVPQEGAFFELLADNVMRIGHVVPEWDDRPTPAAESGIPDGAWITRINDKPVARWAELVEELRQNAGSTVTLAYRSEPERGAEQTCQFAVPHSILTKLGLKPGAHILSIDGHETVPYTQSSSDRSGAKRERTYPIPVSHPVGIQTALEANIGKSVEVRYREHRAPPNTATVEVTEDMVYPWLSRVQYTVDLDYAQEQTIIRANNPISAMALGADKTWEFIVQVYVVMKRMIVSRSVGVETLSGPVGIVKLGGQLAQAGVVQLLFFLAVISANLAVINFLPLPIVDGGHMVFLTIEKIKGSPVNLRIQMVTQAVGLALIGAAFLYVTLQDLTR